MYDGQSRLSIWSYQVALNVAISFYRCENSRKQGACPIDESTMDLADEPQKRDDLEYNVQHLVQRLYHFSA